jgi:hypothetical protein
MMMSKLGRVPVFCAILLAALGLCLTSACARQQEGPAKLRVAAASDLQPLVEAVQEPYSRTAGLVVEYRPSTGSIADLKAGRADVALLGKEPLPGETDGLSDTVVAYDAICILIDMRSYMGGMNVDEARKPKDIRGRTKGLRGLKMADLQGLFGNPLRSNKDQWLWHGYNLIFRPATKTSAEIPQEDPIRPGMPLGQWAMQAVMLRYEWTLPGKFDTQGALYQKLGLDERSLRKDRVPFLPPYYESEEELISRTYLLDPEQELIENANRPFPFAIAAMSRRVTLKAMAHGFAVRVVPVDGVDPSDDPAEVYNGAYPLSRKIHVLVRQPPPPGAAGFVQFLQSAAGQSLIDQAGFLPLPDPAGGSLAINGK